MTTGTVDDIIADVSKLSTDMAAALNVLNAKIDSQVANLQSQINNLGGGSGGGVTAGIVTTPTNPTVTSGAAEGTVICTLSAPLLTNPTYTIVNGTGRYQISGNQLQVGAVAIDISNGATDTCTIKALGSDGVSSLTQTLNISISPPATGGSVDYNFVTAGYYGGSLTDFSNTQPASYTETWNDGSQTTFQPNTVRRTDLGVKVIGSAIEFIGPHSMDASAWTGGSAAGWAQPIIQADLGVDSNGFHGVRFACGNAANGGLDDGGIPEAIDAGEVLTVKIRARDPSDGSTSGGLWVGIRTGAAGSTAEEIFHVSPGKMTGGHQFLSGEFAADNNAQVVGYTINADGTYDLVVNWTSPSAYAAGQAKLMVSTQAQNTTAFIDFFGGQVTKGTTDQPWTATNAAIVTQGADQLVYNDPNGIFANAQGYVCLEIQEIDHATLGTGGIVGSVAGKFLTLAGASLLEPVGPTAFKAKGGAATALGLSGFRGICRLVLTWDNTANSGAGSWAAYGNGGKIASGTGATGAAGVVGLLSGITGRLRRFTAGKSVLSNVDAQAMSQIWNKTFVNPGKALVPGSVTQTLYDDFDANSLQTMTSWNPPSHSDGSYYNSFEDLAAQYAPSADGQHFWKPRYHFFTNNQYGEGDKQINGELQEYLDPQFANYKTISFANSCLVGVTAQTSTLDATSQGQVVDNPQTPGTKYPYVSWCVTTFGDPSTGGGFMQQYGIFNMRGKLPAYKSSWPAFWLYNYSDTSELDIEEYYGVNKTQITTAMHTDNFAHNQPWTPAMEMGYDISADFHDWTAWWVQGTYKKYFDGEEVLSSATITDFDNKPKFLLLNLAVQSADTDAAGLAAMPWQTQIDRVRVFQFGA